MSKRKKKSSFDPMTPEELRAAYDEAKRKFKAEFNEAEFVRQLTEEESTPFENVLAELEEINRQGKDNKKRKRA